MSKREREEEKEGETLSGDTLSGECDQNPVLKKAKQPQTKFINPNYTYNPSGDGYCFSKIPLEFNTAYQTIPIVNTDIVISKVLDNPGQTDDSLNMRVHAEYSGCPWDCFLCEPSIYPEKYNHEKLPRLPFCGESTKIFCPDCKGITDYGEVHYADMAAKYRCTGCGGIIVCCLKCMYRGFGNPCALAIDQPDAYEPTQEQCREICGGDPFLPYEEGKQDERLFYFKDVDLKYDKDATTPPDGYEETEFAIPFYPTSIMGTRVWLKPLYVYHEGEYGYYNGQDGGMPMFYICPGCDERFELNDK